MISTLDKINYPLLRTDTAIKWSRNSQLKLWKLTMEEPITNWSVCWISSIWICSQQYLSFSFFFQTKLFQIYTTNNDTKIIQLSLLLVPYCIHLHWCRVWNLCLDSYLVLHFDLQGVLFFDSGTNEVANVTKLPPLILKKCMQICSLVSQHAVTQVARY